MGSGSKDPSAGSMCEFDDLEDELEKCSNEYVEEQECAAATVVQDFIITWYNTKAGGPYDRHRCMLRDRAKELDAEASKEELGAKYRKKDPSKAKKTTKSGKATGDRGKKALHDIACPNKAYGCPYFVKKGMAERNLAYHRRSCKYHQGPRPTHFRSTLFKPMTPVECASDCPNEVRRGQRADSEGVFHDYYSVPDKDLRNGYASRAAACRQGAYCWVRDDQKRGENEDHSVLYPEHKDTKQRCDLNATTEEKKAKAYINALAAKKLFTTLGFKFNPKNCEEYQRLCTAFEAEEFIMIDGEGLTACYDICAIAHAPGLSPRVIKGSKRKSASQSKPLLQKDKREFTDHLVEESGPCVHHGCGIEVAIMDEMDRRSGNECDRINSYQAIASAFGRTDNIAWSWGMDFLTFLIHPAQDRALHRAKPDCEDEVLVLGAFLKACALTDEVMHEPEEEDAEDSDSDSVHLSDYPGSEGDENYADDYQHWVEHVYLPGK
jgi:hypothetical protein